MGLWYLKMATILQSYKNPSRLRGERLVYLGLLPCFLRNLSVWYASNSVPLSSHPEYWTRKYTAVGYLFVWRCFKSRSRTETSLPPLSIILPALFASSYAPGMSFTFRTLSRVNLVHRLGIGIVKMYSEFLILSILFNKARSQELLEQLPFVAQAVARM